MASSADVIESLGIQITSNASGATKSLNTLNKRLEKLIGNLTSVQSKSAGAVIGIVGTQAQKTATSTNNATKSFNAFNNSTKNAKGNIKSLASAFGHLYANYFLLIRGTKQLGKAIESSMDYVETYNYFNVTMDKIGKQWSKDYKKWGYDTAEAYGESFQQRIQALNKKMTGYELGEQGEATYTGEKNLGLDVEQMMNYQASIGAVTNSLGLMGEVSVNTQKAMSMLAADLSSFKNIDLKSVMTNLQSGLIGQSRALYKFGLDITAATMQTYAYELGLSKAVSEMTQGEKMQLRLLMILNQSKVAWGDQANTLNSVANQYRILKQQFGNLARTIGNLFLPIVEKVLPVVNGLVIAMNQLLQSFGISLWGDNWLKDIMAGTSAGYTGDDVLGDLADDSEDLSEGLDKASKNAKKLKNNLIGIDKLNIISPDTGDDSGASDGKGTSGGIDLSNQIASAVADYEKVWEEAFKRSENKAQKYANRIVSAFKTGDWESVGQYFSTKLSNALSNIPWNNIYANAKGFGKGFAGFLNGLITPDLFSNVGSTIAKSLNTAIYSALSFGKELNWNQIGKSIGSGINSFFENFDFVALAETLNTWAKGLKKQVKAAIDEINWETVFKGLKDFLKTIDIETIEVIIGYVTIKKIGKWVLGGGLIATLKEVVKQMFKKVFGATSLITLIKTEVGTLFSSGFLSGLGQAATSLGTLLTSSAGANGLAELFFIIEDSISSFVGKTNWNQFWADVWSIILGPFSDALYNENGNLKRDTIGKKFYNFIAGAFFDTKYVKSLGTDTVNFFNKGVQSIMEGDLLGASKNLLGTIASALGTAVSFIIMPLTTIGDNIVKTIFGVDVNKEAEEFVENAVEAIKQKFNSLKEKLGSFWNGLKEGLSDALNAIISGFETLANKIVDAWNWIKKSINSLSFELPDWIPGAGGEKFGFSLQMTEHITIDRIPKYEAGGFPEDGLFFANHSELVGKFSNGKTAVANNKQITDGIEEAAYRGMMRAFSSQGSNNGMQKIEVPVIINGREIARAVNKENARSGAKMLSYGTGYN